MLRKTIITLLVGIFYVNQTSLEAVNLRKLAYLETNKVFAANVHSGHDMTNLFFDQGRKLLVGQDFQLSETYKFYFANNPVTAEKENKTPIQIKEFEELSFSLSNFCEQVKDENKNYTCDVTKQNYESGIFNRPLLWFYASEQGLAAVSIDLRSPNGNRDVFMIYVDTQKKEIKSISKLPGDHSLGLAYINEGDLNDEKLLWYTDSSGRLFRVDFTTKEVTENKSCGDQFSKIYSEQSAQLEAEKKRTGKDLIRMPFLRLTPFVSADEKYVLLFDYSDIDDGDPVNQIGLAYYCELSSGKMEKLPGQHTVYAATMSIPGKIIYYTNQRGEYFSLDLKTKKLTQIAKGRTMGDRMVVFQDSAIVYDDDYTWVDARKLSNLKSNKFHSVLSMEKLKNDYSNRIVINPQSSTLLLAVYDQKDHDKPSKAKLFLYKMSVK